MNPFEDWLQRLLGKQQQQPPVGPVQPQIQTQQPFSAPTPAPDPQNPFVEGLRNVMRNVGTFAAARPEMRMGRAVGNAVLDGAPQREAWNALMGQQPSFPSQNVQNMTPDQQFQVFSDVGGMVNPIAGATRIKLSGQFREPPNNFFESLFSRLQRGIQDAPVSMKGATAKEWLGILTPKTAKGEREFTGIESLLKADPERVITKSELDELAKKKGVQFEEHQSEQYKSLTQPGESENYRIISIVKRPTLEQQEARRAVGFTQDREILPAPYNAPHTVPENTIAHLRLTDRIDGNTGEKVLFVEEMQSDWMQAARDYGTIPGNQREFDLEINNQATELVKKMTNIHEEFSSTFNDDINYLVSNFRKESSLSNFKSTVKLAKESPEIKKQFDAWVDKNAREAVAPTVKELGWNFMTTGAKFQILEHKVPAGPFQKTEEWVELLVKRTLKEAVDGGYSSVVFPSGARVSNVVGGSQEAMENFYEKMIPNIVKDYSKKLGAKIELEGAPTRRFISRAGDFIDELSGAMNVIDTWIGDGFDLTPAQGTIANAVSNILRDFRLKAEQGEAIPANWESLLKGQAKNKINEIKDQIAGNNSMLSEEKQAMIEDLDKEFVNLFEGHPFNINRGSNTMLTFRITPDLKSAVSKGQRLWSTGAAALPGTMELLRQRNGIPKREEKKKK